MNRLFLFSILAITSLTVEATPIEEVVVEAEFWRVSAIDTASSVSVLSDVQIDRREASHLEELLNLVPNLNFSSGASRGRFFQIRGIGERSEFVDPINPSVGLIIDGIDFTGVGLVATVPDVKQVEVLRGPQGTLYGANALAGLINIVSNEPGKNAGETKVTLGHYGKKEFEQSVSGPISDTLGMRVAYSKVLSNGYIYNRFLQRNDTNNIDESTLRAKWDWTPSEDLSVKVTSMVIDVDNGYDAFSLDNNRKTLSDEPGTDSTLTKALGVDVEYTLSDTTTWEMLLSSARSDLVYGYDEDWTFREVCAITDSCAFWQYSTVDRFARDKGNLSFDTRWLSADEDEGVSWVAGLYARKETNELVRTYTNNDPAYATFYGPPVDRVSSQFTSDYESMTAAVYGQLEFSLSSDLSLTSGLRLESRDWDYKDSDDANEGEREMFWGGNLTLEYTGLENGLVYGTISRGFKSGGTNVPAGAPDTALDVIPRTFDAEYMWNYELGHKASMLNGRVKSQVAIFYQDRDEIQVKQSVVTSQADGAVDGDCPCDFSDYFENAAGGKNYGVEVQVNAYFTDVVEWWLSAGILEAEYTDFQSASHVDSDGGRVDLSGREQAHAPGYQYATGINLTPAEYFSVQLDVEGKDSFYLSPRHSVQTESYTLYNARVEYSGDLWSLAFWGKNLTDEDVIVRGFGSFGNDPRGCEADGSGDCYSTEPFFQYGAPRVLGVTARFSFQ